MYWLDIITTKTKRERDHTNMHSVDYNNTVVKAATALIEEHAV